MPDMLDFSSVSTHPQSSRMRIDEDDETVVSAAVQRFPLPQVQDVRPLSKPSRRSLTEHLGCSFTKGVI